MATARVQVLRFAWQAVRLPVFAFLITLLPIVQFTLSAVAILSILTAFFFKFVGAPNFPFWGMLGTSLGCTLLLIAYYGFMRLFSR